MTTALNIVLQIWLACGTLIIIIMWCLFPFVEGMKWHHVLWASAVYIIGIVFLTGGKYSTISIFMGAIGDYYNAFRDTAATLKFINSRDLSKQQENFLLLYMYFKYFLKGAIAGYIMLFIGRIFIFPKILLIGALIVYITAIFMNFGLNLNFLINNEVYISLILIGIIVLFHFFNFIRKKLIGDKGEEKNLRFIVASLLSFCILLGLDAWGFRYLDRWIIFDRILGA